MDNDKKGLLFVISGPSGVGKGTICKKLLERRKELKLSVSVTTRAPRPGEIEGVNYFFRSEEQFQDMIERDEFLEYMCVFGKNHYGTPKAYVAEQRAQGNDVILEIDVNGALNVKKRCPDAVMIFIAPPSMETLKKRLVGRGTETEEAVERRFAEAVKELLQQIDLEQLSEQLHAELKTTSGQKKARVVKRLEVVDAFRISGNKPEWMVIDVLPVIPPELQYVEVISVTASSGYDANTGEAVEDEKELPSTVTLLVTTEQAKVLAGLEQESELHLALVYRGAPENADEFIAAQDALIEELYAEPEAEAAEGAENAESAETEESEGADPAAESEADAE